MKKLTGLTLGLLVSSLVMAADNGDGVSKPSTFAVWSSSECRTVHVLYKTEQRGSVKISIMNDKNDVVFSEILKKRVGFIRPYNFNELPDGEYTIRIDDNAGSKSEKIKVGLTEPAKMVHVSNLTGTERKFMMTGFAPKESDLLVRIFDAANQMIFEESRKVNGQFGEVYNIGKNTGSYTMEVSDHQGVLKTVHN
jgi:hypothetical protein